MISLVVLGCACFADAATVVPHSPDSKEEVGTHVEPNPNDRAVVSDLKTQDVDQEHSAVNKAGQGIHSEHNQIEPVAPVSEPRSEDPGQDVTQSNRRQSQLEQAQDVIIKYATSRSHLVGGVASLTFAVLGGFISYCQLLNPLGIPFDVMMGDLEETERLLRNPEIDFSCTDEFLSECTEQYLYSTFFGVCTIFLTVSGVKHFHMNYFQDSSNDPQDKYRNEQDNTDEDHSDSQCLVSRYLDSIKSHESVKNVKEFFASFKPGAERFWAKSIFFNVMDIVLQLSKCFFIAGSYATTSPELTIAQLSAIILHIILCSVAWYKKSTVGFVESNWAMDFLYIAIRLSAGGLLSMTCLGFVDFLSVASPFWTCMQQVKNVVAYLTSRQQEEIVEDQQDRDHRPWRFAVFVVVVLGSIICGAVGIYITASRGLYGECGEGDKDIDLPAGLACELYGFDLFLTPSCTCISLLVDATRGCGFYQQDYEQFQVALPYIKDALRLEINHYNDVCPSTMDDFEQISIFQKVLILDLQNYPFTELPHGLSKLSQLQYLFIVSSPVRNIDPVMLNDWPDLQVLTFLGCPDLLVREFFQDIELQRLERMERMAFYGVSTCPKDSDLQGVGSVTCVSTHETEECNGIPQWLLEIHVDTIKETTESMCTQRCYFIFHGLFKLFDRDANGLLDAVEYSVGLKNTYYDLGKTDTIQEQEMQCMVDKIREAVPFPQSLYPNSTSAHGLTLLEVLGFVTSGYTTCASCDFVQEYISDGADVFQASLQQILPVECEGLKTMTDAKQLEEYCNTKTSSCGGVCPTFLSIYLPSDFDGNGVFSEEEMRSAASLVGFQDTVPEGLFKCWAALAPSCLVDPDTYPGAATPDVLEMELGPIIAIGHLTINEDPTTCGDC